VQEFNTKKEMIYHVLKEEIYNGVFRPGEKLVISHLAKRFNCSEIPVREAMTQLDSENLIKFKPHIGAIVSPLSLKDIQSIFELRVEIEGLATRLAVRHMREVDFEALRDIIAASKEAFEQKDYGRFEKLNVDYHVTIYNRSDNEWLIKIIQDLWKNSNRYSSVFKKNDTYIQQSLQDHDAIYDALYKRDGLLAEQIMLNHMERVKQEMLSLTKRDFLEVEERLRTE